MKKITRKHLRPFLEKHATDQKILEIGGGRHNHNHSHEDLFPKRHTFDIDPKRKPDTVGDAHELPFTDNSYEFILCTEVLEHLHSPWVAISEMKRVLKPRGKLILTTRFVYPIHDAPNDYYRYTEYGLRYLFKDWDTLEIISETETMSAIGALLQRIGFQTDVKGGKLVKAMLYGTAFIFDKLNFLIKQEYGDIKKETLTKDNFTTGYYMTVNKK